MKTRCPVCGWRPVYRSPKAARRAARAHTCRPDYRRTFTR